MQLLSIHQGLPTNRERSHAEGKRLSGADRSAEMEHLIHFAQKVTS